MNWVRNIMQEIDKTKNMRVENFNYSTVAGIKMDLYIEILFIAKSKEFDEEKAENIIKSHMPNNCVLRISFIRTPF